MLNLHVLRQGGSRNYRMGEGPSLTKSKLLGAVWVGVLILIPKETYNTWLIIFCGGGGGLDPPHLW